MKRRASAEKDSGIFRPTLVRSTLHASPIMLVRVVRMTFRPEAVPDFLALFERTAPRIRAAPGCHRLDLWRDAADPARFATHSLWTDAAALDAYRASSLFRTTWAATKPLFAEPATATSYDPVWPAAGA